MSYVFVRHKWKSSQCSAITILPCITNCCCQNSQLYLSWPQLKLPLPEHFSRSGFSLYFWGLATVLFLFKYSGLWDIYGRSTEAVKTKTHRRCELLQQYLRIQVPSVDYENPAFTVLVEQWSFWQERAKEQHCLQPAKVGASVSQIRPVFIMTKINRFSYNCTMWRCMKDSYVHLTTLLSCLDLSTYVPASGAGDASSGVILLFIILLSYGSLPSLFPVSPLLSQNHLHFCFHQHNAIVAYKTQGEWLCFGVTTDCSFKCRASSNNLFNSLKQY